MDLKAMTDAEVTAALTQLPGWDRQGATITRVFDRRTFKGSLAFVNTVADLADRANHHPDLDIRYAHVRVTLTTHDAGGLTTLDVQLARQIDAAAR